MKEIANDPALRASGTVVEVQQEKRGSYLHCRHPIKFSGFTRGSLALRCSGSIPTGAGDAGL